ncbi:hypothetical protein [Streptomyces tubercidicus]|nr:hypothetical protein [Streptomyces tubercidicus]WAU14275.1 hypothetical protein STRTU_004873 [Streptomyces tubercidicus]
MSDRGDRGDTGDLGDINARLLPWSSVEGKPCFVVGDGSGYVSRLADEIEAAQLGLADERIEEAQRLLEGRKWSSGELQLLTVELTEALVEVRRIAESRGARLAVLRGRDGGGPQLSAEAYDDTRGS